MTLRSGTALLLALCQGIVLAQKPLPPGFVQPPPAKPQVSQPGTSVLQQQTPPPAAQPQAAPAKPGAPAAAQTPSPATPITPTVTPSITPSPSGILTLQNASLREVIDLLARQLKINYIIDPRVNGAVTINTYGETKNMDNRALLDLILRINNAAMIQVGEIYRIVPLTDVQRLPLMPEINSKATTEDDRTMLNLMFLKFATVEELAKLLDQFLGEGGKMWSYAPANLLMIQDSRRNMRRLLELVSLFDNDTFANQRVRLFNIENGRPSDVAKELESILKSISLNEKNSPVKLLPIDRINTLVAVAPNAGVFKDIENWLTKLDIAVEASSGTISNFVYRVRYGYAPTLAMAIMGLYSNNPYYAMSMMMMGSMGMGGGMMGGGMMGGMPGMMGGGMMGGMPGMMGGGYGMPGMMGGGMMGGMPGMMGGGYGMPGMMGGGYAPAYNAPAVGFPPTGAAGTPAPGAAGTDQTGSYLGAGQPGQQQGPRQPRIVPNPFDNSLLIQGTRQEYESITKLLRDIDVPPRQVLIEAKIYEVDLNGAFSNGVTAYLTRRGSGLPGDATRPDTQRVVGNLVNGAVNLSVGALVGQSRELLLMLNTQELNTRARIISAPSVIATDSVPASINVGTEVPTLAAQAVTGAQQGGDSLFANSIQSRNSGVTLNITARVNPMGVVTMTVNQEVSAPIAPSAGAAIQSPSFSKRTVQTQVTLQDGDTIAIGGIINESNTSSSIGIPGLHRIPIIGYAFGNKSISKERTELIIFLTPKVIFDMNNVNEASDELKSRLKSLSKYVRNE